MANEKELSLADFFDNDSSSIMQAPKNFLDWLKDKNTKAKKSIYEQNLLDAPGAKTTILSSIDGSKKKMINLTSYNYLGLSNNKEVIKIAKKALDKYGMSASGAPYLGGTYDLHTNFINKLADFKNKEDALLFSSGYGCNLGVMQALLRRGDYVIMDEKIHRSIVDGAILSGAKKLFFRHNDMDSLEQMLKRATGKRSLICIEGVYSMDGDLADLPNIVKLAKQYQSEIYIDEAHSTLLFGKNGRGVAEYFGLESEIALSFGTLSKAFGGVGGFICGNKDLLNYIKNYAGSWNFSCSLPPPIVAGLNTSLEIAIKNPKLKETLKKNSDYFRDNLIDMGLNIGNSQSQIIPIIIGSSSKLLLELTIELQKRGLFIQAIDYPAVPENQKRFRISVTSNLTIEDIDLALDIIEDTIVPALKKNKVSSSLSEKVLNQEKKRDKQETKRIRKILEREASENKKEKDAEEARLNKIKEELNGSLTVEYNNKKNEEINTIKEKLQKENTEELEKLKQSEKEKLQKEKQDEINNLKELIQNYQNQEQKQKQLQENIQKEIELQKIDRENIEKQKIKSKAITNEVIQAQLSVERAQQVLNQEILKAQNILVEAQKSINQAKDTITKQDEAVIDNVIVEIKEDNTENKITSVDNLDTNTEIENNINLVEEKTEVNIENNIVEIKEDNTENKITSVDNLDTNTEIENKDDLNKQIEHKEIEVDKDIINTDIEKNNNELNMDKGKEDEKRTDNK